MAVKHEKIEENKIKLTVTVEASQFNNALDHAFKKVVKDVNIPGFRKGKVPRNIFEKKFGVESLYEEALNYLIPIEYTRAIEETKIEPVAHPEFDIDYENMGIDKELTFYATVVVKPEVKLGQYKGIEVENLSTEVTDNDIDAEINKLLEKQAELVVKETEAVLGDTVVIDYEGFKDGVAFEGGKGSNHSLQLGSNSFIPGFEEQLVGIKANDERTINVKFPEQYHSEELAGKDAEFKVFCHELNRENVENVEQLRATTKETLVKQAEEKAKNHVIDTVVDTVANNAEINIPQEMIDFEADRMMDDAGRRLEQQGINLEMYLQFTGSTKEGLREQLKGDAVKRLRYNLTIEKIAEVENIEVTQEEFENELNEIAKNYNVTVEQVRQAFTNTRELKEEIKLRKTVDFLVLNAVKK